MTDDNGAGQPEATSGGTSDAISGTMAKLGPGEKLAVVGAAALLVVWVLFDFLIDEYSTGSIPFALALVTVGAAYTHHNKGSAHWGISYQTVVLVAAALIGVFGVRDIVEEVRAGIFDADASTIIGALAYYAAAIVAGVGAWQLKGRG